MKRSAAATADLKEEEGQQQQSPPPRSTRSTVRDAEMERQRLEEEQALEKIRLQRAKDLTATPRLQALPLVLVSGYLYKHEIRSAALVSKRWKSIWVEAQNELPDYCQVEIKVRHFEPSWPTWVKIRRLQHALPTQQFSRSIFQQMSDLKIAAEKAKGKKQKIRDELPKWGIDFLGIDILTWGPLSRNDGGIHIAFKKGPYEKIIGWSIRIDHELILWTWENFHKWKKIYNWQPLWECEIFDDADDDDEEEMPPPTAVAPRPLPPPGPGRIDYYFQRKPRT